MKFKHLLVLIVLGTLGLSMNAQDLLITTSGDSIACKIVKIKPDKVDYKYLQGSDAFENSIPLGDVKFYKLNYYSRKDVQHNVTSAVSNPIRFAINAGYLYRFGEDELEDEMKKGIVLQTEFHVFSNIKNPMDENTSFGYGFTMSFHNTNLDVAGFSSFMNDFFIAPSLMISSKMKEIHKFNVALAPGYLYYWDKLSYEDEYVQFKGSSFAFDLGLSFDFYTSQTFGMGVGVNVNFASISEGTFTVGGENYDAELEDSLDLGRVAISVGFRFK